MKILIVAQYFWPESVGAGVWLHQLATDLVERAHRVAMLTAFPNYPHRRVFNGYRGRLFLRETVGGVDVFRTYIYARPNESFTSRALTFGSFCLSALLGGFRVERPDVIYCVLPPLPLGLTAELIGWAKGAPVVINLQDIHPDIAIALGYLRNGLAIRLSQAMEGSVYRHADAIVVITDSFKENLIGKGVPAEKVHVVPNWADAEAIQPAPRENSFRREARLDREFAIVYSGNFGHNTCLETVIEAARLLASEPYRFLLIGDGVHKQRLEALASSYGLNNLRFLAFQPLGIYPQVLAAGDLHLVSLNTPTSQFSLPSKVMKIMASGRPIVALADRQSDLGHLLERAQCGVVVAPDDSAGLAATVRRLAGAPNALRAMGENARSFLVENFSRGRCVAQIESTLQNVVRAASDRSARAHASGRGERELLRGGSKRI